MRGHQDDDPTNAPRRPARRARRAPGDEPREPLRVGQKLQERSSDRVGTILEFACQYAHPKAEPAFNYLVRWDDGQIQALHESALDGGYGLNLID